MSKVNLPSQPLLFEMIIDLSLSNFELSGIGMSSNSAKLSSEPGSPTGPLTGNKDSPAHEYKKINNKKYFIDFLNKELKINPFNLNVND